MTPTDSLKTLLFVPLSMSLALAAGCDLAPVDDDDSADSAGDTDGDDDDDDDDDVGDDVGDDDDGDETGDDDDDDADDGDDDDDDDDDDDMPSGPFACTDGELLLGNPVGDPAARPTDGSLGIDSATDGAGLPARRVVPSPVDPSKLVIAAGPEIWYLDNNDGTIHRILGDDDSGEYRPGTCDLARIGSVSDLAFRSDGTLVFGDHGGNAVNLVTDPFGPDCEMHAYAGTQEPALTNPLPHEPDYIDGPVAEARFAGPDYLTVGDDDTIYVVDIGNRAIRAIGTNDEVTTVSELPDTYVSNSLAAFAIVAGADGMLYMPVKGSVESSQNGTILRIDPTDGSTDEVATGRDEPWLIGSSGPTIAGLAEVRPGLLATYVNGRLFTIDTQDGTVEHVAGDGSKPWNSAEYASDYDPFALHPAMELELDNHSATTSGAGGFLTWTGEELLFSGLAGGFVTVAVSCG